MPLFLVKFWPYILVLVIVLGGLGYAYYKGGENERNSTNTKVLEQIEDERKSREKTDNRTRGMSDTDATNCLRKPTGC